MHVAALISSSVGTDHLIETVAVGTANVLHCGPMPNSYVENQQCQQLGLSLYVQ
jgi:hypothetical protein